MLFGLQMVCVFNNFPPYEMGNKSFEEKVIQAANINAKKVLCRIENYLTNPSDNIDRIIREVRKDVNGTLIEWSYKAKDNPLITEIHNEFLKGADVPSFIEKMDDSKLYGGLNTLPNFFAPLSKTEVDEEARKEDVKELKKEVVDSFMEMLVYDKTVDKVLDILSEKLNSKPLIIDKIRRYLYREHPLLDTNNKFSSEYYNSIDDLSIVFTEKEKGLQLFLSVEKGFDEEKKTISFNEYSVLYFFLKKKGMLREGIPESFLISYLKRTRINTNSKQFNRKKNPSDSLERILKQACAEHKIQYP